MVYTAPKLLPDIFSPSIYFHFIISMAFVNRFSIFLLSSLGLTVWVHTKTLKTFEISRRFLVENFLEICYNTLCFFKGDLASQSFGWETGKKENHDWV